VIEQYLAELDAALRRHRVSARRRRRFLAEAEDHIACGPEGVTTFGDPEHLARQLAALEQPRRIRILSLILVATVAGFAAPLYGIPENTLPPAPAAGLPATITWKLDWAVALYAAALVCAVLAVAVSWSRPRLAAWPAWLAVVALSGSTALGSAAAAQWPVGDGVALAAVVPVAGVLLCLACLTTARLASAAWQPSRR
jgi:hypothetical protein